MSQDDELEMEIVPAPDFEPTPAPKRRRARTPNPAVDDVIHTGEIAPRSMIVRATDSSPALAKIEIHEDSTEKTQIPVPVVAFEATPRRLVWIWFVAALVPAIIAGVLFAIDKPATGAAVVEDQSAHLAVQNAAQFIGTTLDADAKATLMRADVIASSSMLRAGILTDAQTLEDMAKDKDVVFSLKPGETVEVFQNRDGTRTSVLRLPKGAPAISAPPIGKAVVGMRDGALHVIANAEIPAQQGTSGEVVLDVPIELEPFKKRIADHVSEASLGGLGAPIVLVKTATAAAGGAKVTVAIENDEQAKLSLDAVIRTKTTAASKKSSLAPIRAASLGLAGVLMLIFLVALVRKPKH